MSRVHNKIFVKLVQLAKVYSNANILQIVFISSEGDIIPLINKTLASSKAMTTLEILAITNDKGKTYLMARGMPEQLV